MIAEKWDISREDMEEFALASHERALAAIDEGRFEREIVPYVNLAGEKITTDEGPRRGTTLEKMASLKTLVEGGRLTAAVSSQISDAASGMLIASEDAVKHARAQAAGAYPPPVGARRQPGLHADRADPGHGVCAARRPA